ncbi:hypothetical protein PIB30_059066, partial [Stylosanthes scabra]|nr:hypothetical protein [Stylosanthes scabra]
GPIILPPPMAAAGGGHIVWMITPVCLPPPPPPPPQPPSGLARAAPSSYNNYQRFTLPTQPPPPPRPPAPVNATSLPQPLQVNGKVANTSGSGSSSDSPASRGGTGVFFPPPSSSSPHNNHHHYKLTRFKGTWKRKNKNESKVNDGAVKQQNTNIPSPDDYMGLPKEWTY